MSAAFTIFAFSGFDDSINFINWFTELFSPFLIALMIIEPYKFIVPLNTSSPVLLSTGRDSPVKAAWLIDELPSMIIPSQGIISPGKTFIMSFVLMSLAFIFFSVLWSFINVAVVGVMLIRFLISF